MASGLTTFLVVAGVGVGGYALYRWWEEDRKKGEHWRRKEAQNLKDAHVSGYFTGVQPGPAIARADYAGYYGMDAYVGQGRSLPTPPPLDPRNCLCPMTLDPLDPRLPDSNGMVKCPCTTPGAVRPPYAGYMAVGRGGGGGHFHPHYQQQQQQDQQQDGDGMSGDPNAPPPYQPPPQRHYHPHHGRR